MEKFNISGIQQVGVGTVDFSRSWNWFIDMFGINVRILEDDTVAERMLPYTGNKAQKRHACITVSLQGGGGLEVWQYSERKPQPCPFQPAVADLGIFAAKIKCRDVAKFHETASKKWDGCTDICRYPDGTPCFYIKDLYGNWFQIIQRTDIYIEQKSLTGGVVGALIGVTDMEKSMEYYQQVLGFDKVLFDVTGSFDDWAALPEGGQRYRRVLLGTSASRTGAFSGLYGDSMVELVQALDRVPRKIYEGRFWGDPGFIQLCFDVTGMNEFGRFCAEKGYPFTVDSCPDGQIFDMGDASGRFTYNEDPDGTLVEFVESYRIPVVKKLGWFIDMGRRDASKPLPKFLFRMMGIVSKVRKV